MDVLQAAIPILAMADPELYDETAGGRRQAIRLITRMPAIVAAWQRIREGVEPLPSDDTLCPCREFPVAAERANPMMKLPAISTSAWCSMPTIPSTLPPLPAGRWSPRGRTCMRRSRRVWEPFPEASTAGPMPR